MNAVATTEKESDRYQIRRKKMDWLCRGCSQEDLFLPLIKTPNCSLQTFQPPSPDRSSTFCKRTPPYEDLQPEIRDEESNSKSLNSKNPKRKEK
ncbi:unnamed protein product [Microthlaspi erraticum]|uniref:Uncharacterized protein n=1 Tax=Microthlaspi erraticum TaxID=1685480 RepID=A0A6D2J2K1_9BRAS|nr:unnamed protein product [Microthlaspi erraticum]